MLAEKCWCFVLTADNHNLSLPHALKELNNLAQGDWGLVYYNYFMRNAVEQFYAERSEAILNAEKGSPEHVSHKG